MNQSLRFDKKDRDLLVKINEVIDSGNVSSAEQETFRTSLHPHGIQNMVSTHEERMAMAEVNLLQRLNDGTGVEARLSALKTLHEEVLYSAQTPFRFNTSRVLIQLMKEIVRARGNEEEQLRLIHDFQKVAAGNPRIVRAFLSKFFLLEMPEEWNQKTMDDHVHDANTMGRKNPTYLVMDARVKGIRRLTVVYYNFVDPKVVYELYEAAHIMGISVRLGIKFKARFHDRYVEFLWTPKGFTDTKSVLDFLKEPETEALMQEGRAVEDWAREEVLQTLEVFNAKHAAEISKEWGIEVPPLSEEEFDDYVGMGQTTLIRLSEFVHSKLLPLVEAEAEKVKQELLCASAEDQGVLQERLKKLDELTSVVLYQRWLRPSRNPEIPSLSEPADDGRPNLLKIDVQGLLSRLMHIRPSSRITLLTGKLTDADVLELLWFGEGRISHLEILNMKERELGRVKHVNEINQLQQAINRHNAIELKRIIQDMRQRPEIAQNPERSALFNEFLENIPRIMSFYANQPLGSRFGSDSTTILGTRFGMGFAVPDTLPRGAQKMIEKESDESFQIPLHVPVQCIDVYSEPEEVSPFVKWVRKNLGFTKFGMKHSREWVATYANAEVTTNNCNVVSLGGITRGNTNGLVADETRQKKEKTGFSYTNTTILNIIKVTIGFLPAFLTFMLTQNWWVLAWFGALIWFSITGIRNIIQAVIAGGGFQKGARIDWKSLINWSRVSDSLMYTGMSVVLLEGFTRNVLLGHILGISVDKAPLLVFSIIALANGLYISSHNIFRGFPKTAVVGNLFRSILAIPVAMVYNVILAMILPIITGMPAAAILVPAAAIVSKFASDTVAGVIESVADRRNNYRLRTSDFRMSTKALFSCFECMELAFPKKDILSLMSRPADFIRVISERSKSMEIECIVISLDLMYIWYYQPCAQHAFLTELKRMSAEERLVFVRFQKSLTEYKEVSRLFLSGMLGSNFSKALAFYLDNYKAYLTAIDDICRKIEERSPVELQEAYVKNSPLTSAVVWMKTQSAALERKFRGKKEESLGQEAAEKTTTENV